MADIIYNEKQHHSRHIFVYCWRLSKLSNNKLIYTLSIIKLAVSFQITNTIVANMVRYDL